ncbi:MAG: flagellar hook-basal body complex protein [Pseudomonadota bacterium]
MDSANAVNVTRQTALADTLDVIANNLANMSTGGYRREGVVFSEYVKALENSEVGSLSMADARGRYIDLSQGQLNRTGGQFDLAIEGPGFFQVETPDGPRLTRAGAFRPNAAGELVDADGRRLLDAAGGPIFVPAENAAITVSPDGAVSADGQLIAQIGVFDAPASALRRDTGTLLTAAADVIQPVAAPRIAQGYLEGSNVNPIVTLTQMIEVQRAYEMGSQLMSQQSDLQKQMIDRLGSQN